MSEPAKIKQDNFKTLQQKREKISQLIGHKLEEQLAAKHINANRVAKTTGMKPETLYKIRDGLQLPSCDTIIKVKQMIPELNLNWWLFDQGDANMQSVEVLKEENTHLKKKVDEYRALMQDLKNLLSKMDD